jgi:hypothetical protein
MSKVGSYDPFKHLIHKLWQKKGRESNCQIDSRPLKVKNRPDFLACMWRETYRWKALDEGYNFTLDLISIRGLHAKLWDPKVAGVPILVISGLPFRSLETKCHLDVGLLERHIVYYKGGGGGFLQVRAVVSLVSPSLPVARPSTKSAPSIHVWVNKCLSFFLVLSQSSSTPFNSPKVLWARERAPTVDSSVVFILDSHLNLSLSLGARQNMSIHSTLQLVHTWWISIISI